MRRFVTAVLFIIGPMLFSCSKSTKQESPVDPGPIIEGVLEGWASWSPDGRYMAYSRPSRNEEEVRRYGLRSIWVYDFETDRFGFLVGPGDYPEWSPGAEFIAFTDVGGLYYYYPSQKVLRQICDFGGEFGWSPQGDRLLFAGEGCRIADTLGNIIRDVAPVDTTPGFWQTIQGADWATSGHRIMISRKNSIDVFDVITVDTLGNLLQVLASDSSWANFSYLNWSPDETRFTASVSYIFDNFVRNEVRIYDMNDMSYYVIADSAGMGEWSPDGARIAYQKATWMAPSPEPTIEPDIRRVTVWVSNADGSNAYELLGWPQEGFDSTMFGGGYNWLNPSPPK